MVEKNQESWATMTTACVTLVVVPRERFSFARASLENIYLHTSEPFDLVYVDGNSPRPVAGYLATQARARGFRLIRTEHYLSPNEARNLGWSEVQTKYTVFMDNDVVVAPGWLAGLVRCADETGATIVAPTYCHGVDLELVHMAGGDAGIEERDGVRRFYEGETGFGLKRLHDVRGKLKRRVADVAEFHGMLVRTELLRRVGSLDEKFLSTREHLDFCLTVRNSGGTVYYEPRSTISYVVPPPFSWSDIPYYLLRWSDAWNLSTLRHANAKWQLNDDYVAFNKSWLKPHRQLALLPLRKTAQRLLGAGLGDSFIDALERAVAQYAIKSRQRARHGMDLKNQYASRIPPPAR